MSNGTVVISIRLNQLPDHVPEIVIDFSNNTRVGVPIPTPFDKWAVADALWAAGAACRGLPDHKPET